MGFTGTYYKCGKCKFVYDFDDDACPDCGSDNVLDLSGKEVREHQQKIDSEVSRLEKMLQAHGD